MQAARRYGAAQRKIAVQPSRASARCPTSSNGRRKAVNYDLLVRIADGLGAPPGWMGLAHTTTDGNPLETTPGVSGHPVARPPLSRAAARWVAHTQPSRSARVQGRRSWSEAASAWLLANGAAP
jgi:hypothetical protein